MADETKTPDLLAGINTPRQSRALIKAKTERAAELLSTVERTGTSDAITLPEDGGEYAVLAAELTELRQAHERKFGHIEALDAAMREAQMGLGSDAPAEYAEPERGLSHRAEELQKSFRAGSNENLALLPDGTRATSLDGFWERRGGRSLQRAIAGTGAGGANVVASAPEVLGYWPLPGQTAVHYMLPTRRPLSGYNYFVFIQNKRVTEAAQVAQGAAAPLGSFTRLRYEGSVRRTAVHEPITEELMRDVMQVESLIGDDIERDITEKAARQVLTGDGTGNNWLGLDSVVATSYGRAGGDVPSTGTATIVAGRRTGPQLPNDTEVGSLLKAIAFGITEVGDNGEASPDAVTMRWRLWGAYIGAADSQGRPLFGDVSSARPNMIYGLPLYASNEFPTGTANGDLIATVGAWARWSLMPTWGEPELKIGLNGDDLIEGQQTIVGSLRGNVVFTRPQAFHKIGFA